MASLKIQAKKTYVNHDPNIQFYVESIEGSRSEKEVLFQQVSGSDCGKYGILPYSEFAGMVTRQAK